MMHISPRLNEEGKRRAYEMLTLVVTQLGNPLLTFLHLPSPFHAEQESF